MNTSNNGNPNSPLADRIGAIVRSVASGANACGTLMDRGGRVNEAFIAQSVRPTLEIYEEEAAELRTERDWLSRESEERRRVLEFVYSNSLGMLQTDVAAAVCQALGLARPERP